MYGCDKITEKLSPKLFQTPAQTEANVCKIWYVAVLISARHVIQQPAYNSTLSQYNIVQSKLNVSQCIYIDIQYSMPTSPLW